MPVSTQQNIDLSTGQITFPVQLLTVPGPQGLDIQVGAVYSSAIASQVTIWNEDAPTGILGLGWSLSYPHILRGNLGAYTGTQDPFYLVDNDLYELLPAGTSGTDFLFTCDPYQGWQIRYTPTSEQWTIIKEDGMTYFFGGDLPPEQNRKHMLDAPNSIEWGLRWGNQIGNGQQATSPNVPVQYAVAWHLKTVQTISGQQMVFSYSQELGQINSVSLHYTQAIYLISIQTVPGSATVTFIYKNKSPNEYPTPRAAPGGAQFNAYQQKYETRYLSSLKVVHTSGAHLFTVTLNYTMLNTGNMQKRLLRSLVRTNPAGQVYDPGYLFHYYDEADQVSVMLADSSHMFNTTTNALYGALSGVTLPEGAKVTYQYAQVTLQNTERRLQVEPPANTGWSSPRVYFGPDYTVVTWYNTAQQQLALTVYQWQGSWVLQDFGTISANTNLVQISIGPEFFALLTPGTTNAIQLYHKDRHCFGRWLTQAIPASIMATSTCKTVVGELVYAVLEVTSSKAGQVYQYAWNGTTWVAPTQNPLSLDTPGKAFYDLAASANYTIAITARPDNSRQPFIIRSVYRLDTLNWDTPLQKTVDNFFAPAGRNQYITSSTTQYGVDNLIALASSSFAVFRASSSAMVTTMGEHGSIVTFSAEYRHFFYRWPTDAPEQWTELQAINMVNLPQMPDIKPTLYTTENSILILQNTVKYIYHLNGQSLTMQNLSNNSLNNDPRAAIAGLDMTFSISQSLLGQNYYTLYQYDQNTTQWTPQPNVTLPDQYDMEYLLTVLIPTVTAMLDLLFMAVPVGELLGTFMAEVLNLVYTVASTALPLCLMRALVQNALALRGLRYLAVGSKGDSGKQIYTRDPISAWGPISNPFLTNTAGNLADDVFDLTDTFALFPISDNNITSLHMFFLRNGTVCGQTVLEPGGQYSVHPSADQPVVSSPGVVLAYPQSAGSLEQAQSFCLYQVFEQLVSGPVTPFVVAQCVVNDGYQTVRTFFSYETESALFDSQRLAPRFEKVTIAVGSGLDTLSSASISGGWTEYYLYSGRYGGPSTSLPATEFTPAGNANTYPALVTGQTYYQRIVSGANSAAIQTIATHWNVFALPSQTGDAAYQLRSIKAVETIDGVSKTLNSTFDLPDGTPHTGQYTGLLIGVTSSNVNATGQAEQLQTTYTYGYQVYPALLQKNILSPIVQTAIVRQQGNPLATVATDVSVITWHIDPTLPPASSATYRWLGTGSSTFTAWTSATPVSADWLKTSAITSMVQGNLLEVQDAAGVSTSYLYDSQFLFPLARFANASVALGEAYYTGFESYENLNGWMQGTAAQVANLSTTTPIAAEQLLSGSAATGNRCLSLTTGISVARALSASGPGYVGTMPSKWQMPGTQFVLTASYKTAPGFTSTSPNQSHVAVWYGTSCYPLNITNTDGKWVYQELRFTLPVTSQSPTNTLPILEITNDGGQISRWMIYVCSLLGAWR